jgi:hypothetical protein
MITCYDVQQIINDNKELDKLIEKLKDIQQGSGDDTIHLWAYKELLIELRACREVIRNK